MLKNIKSRLAQFILDIGVEANLQDIISMLELKPPHADIALKVFKFSKNPKDFSKDVVDKINKSDHLFKSNLHEVTYIGGFINFKFKSEFLLETLNDSIKNKTSKKLSTKTKKVIVDYSSPNVAKPLSIGHLRSTVIGNALCNLARSQGLEVIGLNYLGDWGVQFGKLMCGYLKWKTDYDFKNPFESLYEIYVRFHKESKNDPSLDKEAIKYFKKLESGNEEAISLWKYFIKITNEENQKIYDLLGVKFDLTQGESFYNDKINSAYEFLDKKNLVVKSQGAYVVEVSDNLPPCIVKKSDGSSLYATRDIASALYRRDKLEGDILLYVVGSDQSLHFKQIFGVLDRAGCKWVKNCHHVSFGLYRFKDTKMSTRKGNVIFMSDVLEKAIEISQKKLEEKNPNLSDKEIARSVGIGAILFNDLVNDRVKNVDFSWDKVLDFNGDSGPYVQYSIIRCRSILSKHKPNLSQLDTNDIEHNLVLHLLSFDEILDNSWSNLKPHILAQYLLKICKLFNQFYGAKKILCEDDRLKDSRVTLVHYIETVLSKGADILGIPIPSRM